MGGVSAVRFSLLLCQCFCCSHRLQAIAKTSAAPIERIKLLVQNQDEMVGLDFSRAFFV